MCKPLSIINEEQRRGRQKSHVITKYESKEFEQFVEDIEKVILGLDTFLNEKEIVWWKDFFFLTKNFKYNDKYFRHSIITTIITLGQVVWADVDSIQGNNTTTEMKIEQMEV